MRKTFEFFYGNDRLKADFSSRLLAHKTSHAMILEGPFGVGKKTFALEFCAALCCENKDNAEKPLPCRFCPTCKKILSGESVDVNFIRREPNKASVSVDAIRKIKESLAYAPTDGDYKIFVIEEADLLTAQAQNAFLLSLEEPPTYAVFLLLCEHAENLLETVRSRAQLFHVEPLTDNDLKAYLLGHEKNFENLPESKQISIIRASHGSVGMAKNLLDSKEGEKLSVFRKNIDEFFNLLQSKQGGAEAVKYLKNLPKDRETLTAFFRFLLLALRDILAVKTAENPPLCYYEESETPQQISQNLSTLTVFTLCDTINGLIDDLSVNANIKLTITRFGLECRIV